MQQVDNFAECSMEGSRYVTVTATLLSNSVDSVELAMMLFALQCQNHFFDEVIDIEQFKLNRRIVNLNRQPVGDVVAERSYGRIVIGPAPLAKKVGKAVNKNLRSRVVSIIEEKLLASLLALTVRMTGIATDQRCLDRTRKHHRAGVAMLLECVEQCRRKSEVTLAEVFGILGTVHAGKVEYEVGLVTIAVKVFGRRIDVVLEDLLYLYRVILCLTLLDVMELGTKVTANETLRACN